MSKLKWDEAPRYYHMGISRGVMYLQNFDGTYEPGVAWNGLSSITESPTGGETTKLFADNMVYASLRSQEGLEGSIEAYAYPLEFSLCNGSREPREGVYVLQQPRKSFGMSYCTLIGRDHYQIHILYGLSVQTGERTYRTINDSPEALIHAWDFVSMPAVMDDFKPTASVTIDTRKANPEMIAYLEKMLYGSDDNEPYLPTLRELVEITVSYGLRTLLVDAVSTAGLWRWDPFNFKIDTIASATKRESETRVHFNGSEEASYLYPCIIYTMLPDTSDEFFEMKHYKVTVITDTQTSPVIDAVEDIPSCTLIDSYTEDSLFYNIYSVYY